MTDSALLTCILMIAATAIGGVAGIAIKNAIDIAGLKAWKESHEKTHDNHIGEYHHDRILTT